MSRTAEFVARLQQGLDSITFNAVPVFFGPCFRELKAQLQDEVMASRLLCAADYYFLGTRSLLEPWAASQWIRRKNSQLNGHNPGARPTQNWQQDHT